MTFREVEEDELQEELVDGKNSFTETGHRGKFAGQKYRSEFAGQKCSLDRNTAAISLDRNTAAISLDRDLDRNIVRQGNPLRVLGLPL
jgi:hypothetical protein